MDLLKTLLEQSPIRALFLVMDAPMHSLRRF